MNSSPHGKTIVLGPPAGTHLGDALCLTSLPKALVLEHGCKVYSADYTSGRTVFANNPYLSGYTHAKAISLHHKARGHGHLIQRFQCGLGLTVDAEPKPQVYLSDDEMAWAEAQAEAWPKDNPVCILSTRVITDNQHFNFQSVDWQLIGEAWMSKCTVIQPLLSQPRIYDEQVICLSAATRSGWACEPIVSGALLYHDLTVRQYMALFHVADFFCGGTSGGAHVAAAFDRPALIVAWSSLIKRMCFPSRARGYSTENFLFPQHQFIAGDSLQKNRADKVLLAEFIEMVLAGTANARRMPNMPCLHKPRRFCRGTIVRRL
jgi:hypothetical protein